MLPIAEKTNPASEDPPCARSNRDERLPDRREPGDGKKLRLYDGEKTLDNE
jgi:hypothetical protein